MKQTFLLVTIITLFSITASAQIKKGSTLLGGQFFYNNSNVDWNTAQPDQTNKFGNFGISAGRALKENSVLGLYVSYGHARARNNYNGAVFTNSTADLYNAGVFFKKYKKLAKNFYFFGELGTGYVGRNQSQADVSGANEVKIKSSGGELYLTPGFSYSVLKKLQIEILIPGIAEIQYSVTKTTSLNNNSKENDFHISSNLNSSLLNSVGIGFRFIL